MPKLSFQVNDAGSEVLLINGRHPISCIAVTNDHWFVLGEALRTNDIAMWSLNTGETIRTFQGHEGPIRCLTVGEDHQIVSGSNDGRIKLWDVNSGECKQTLVGHTGPVLRFAFEHTKLFMSGSDDTTLEYWDVKTSPAIIAHENTTDFHQDTVLSLATNKDGALFVSGSDDYSAKLWDINGKLIRTYVGSNYPIKAVFINSQGTILACVYENDSQGQLHGWEIKCLTFSECEGYLETIDQSNTTYIWSTETWETCDALSVAVTFPSRDAYSVELLETLRSGHSRDQPKTYLMTNTRFIAFPLPVGNVVTPLFIDISGAIIKGA
ncbi:hypothetical protein HK098_005496 [Nowakowskiella sp. JEL0407]|nr:hypothetical protein HK098_005496 [Nowakowskiella sp. JEL0407]